MYTNLLSKIEAELNQAAIKLLTDQLTPEQATELRQKKEKLSGLAHNYLALENQYREIAGFNSIY